MRGNAIKGFIALNTLLERRKFRSSQPHVLIIAAIIHRIKITHENMCPSPSQSLSLPSSANFITLHQIPVLLLSRYSIYFILFASVSLCVSAPRILFLRQILPRKYRTINKNESKWNALAFSFISTFHVRQILPSLQCNHRTKTLPLFTSFFNELDENSFADETSK